MSSVPIKTPAGYAVSRATAYADSSGNQVLVSTTQPLPVSLAQSANAALTGNAAASTVAGPFTPVTGRAAVLVLSGTWAGTVRILRSTDGGATKLPLSVGGNPWAQFTGNACEPVWEESEADAQLYIDIALTSGSVSYRLAQ